MPNLTGDSKLVPSGWKLSQDLPYPKYQNTSVTYILSLGSKWSSDTYLKKLSASQSLSQRHFLILRQVRDLRNCRICNCWCQLKNF
ncbi:unnamed protein product [Schistosoma spindalis]|nr:unnamed protein product [Schistosoma spindale]